jgi:hypothetical protein
LLTEEAYPLQAPHFVWFKRRKEVEGVINVGLGSPIALA